MLLLTICTYLQSHEEEGITRAHGHSRLHGRAVAAKQLQCALLYRVWGRTTACFGSKRLDIKPTSGLVYLSFSGIETIHLRHHDPIGRATQSPRQHRTTPATDRDYPPPIGFLLHPAHLRFTFPIQSHVFKWQCRRNRPLLHFTPINIH